MHSNGLYFTLKCPVQHIVNVGTLFSRVVIYRHKHTHTQIHTA